MGKIFKKRSFILADSDVWVLDRNYNRTIALKWKQVQTVVYLDLPFHVVLFRMIKRCLMRGLTREVLWVGNTETVWRHFFTLDSMILWTIKRFHRNRRRYSALFKNPEYAHIHFVRLSSRAEVDKFLASFRRDVAS
jgi:adenylate kinase family enzyme